MKSFLLPVHFKKIASVLAILSFLVLTINHFNSEFFGLDEHVVEWGSKNGLLIFLLIIAFGKGRNESKDLNQLKFKSLKSAVLLAAGILIFESLVEAIFSKDDMDIKSGYEILFFILMFYFINFYWTKNMINTDKNK